MDVVARLRLDCVFLHVNPKPLLMLFPYFPLFAKYTKNNANMVIIYYIFKSFIFQNVRHNIRKIVIVNKNARDDDSALEMDRDFS